MLGFKKIIVEYHTLAKNEVVNGKNENFKETIQFKLITKLYEDIKNKDWLKRQESKSKFDKLLITDFDFERVSTDLGITVESLRSSISFMYTKYESYVGLGVIEAYFKGDYMLAAKKYKDGRNDIVQDYYRDKGRLDNFIPYVKELYSVYYDDVPIYDLNDCTLELAFLRQLSIPYLIKLINGEVGKKAIDKKKLVYLLKIINKDYGNTVDSETLYDYACNNDITKEALYTILGITPTKNRR